MPSRPEPSFTEIRPRTPEMNRNVSRHPETYHTDLRPRTPETRSNRLDSHYISESRPRTPDSHRSLSSYRPEPYHSDIRPRTPDPYRSSTYRPESHFINETRPHTLDSHRGLSYRPEPYHSEIRSRTPGRTREYDHITDTNRRNQQSVHRDHRDYVTNVSEYDYLRRTFSPSREPSHGRYSSTIPSRSYTAHDSTFLANNRELHTDRSYAHRNIENYGSSGLNLHRSIADRGTSILRESYNPVQTRTNIRSRHRSYTRYNMIRSKSANPADRPYGSNETYCTSNLDFQYRPDRFETSVRRPVFSTKLLERKVTQNSDIKLTCNIMADDASVRWLRNDKELVRSSRCRSVYRDGLAMLEIFSAQIADSAKYTCVARNNFGTNSCSSHLKVFPDSEKTPLPPIFTRAMKGNVFM